MARASRAAHVDDRERFQSEEEEEEEEEEERTEAAALRSRRPRWLPSRCYHRRRATAPRIPTCWPSSRAWESTPSEVCRCRYQSGTRSR